MANARTGGPGDGRVSATTPGGVSARPDVKQALPVLVDASVVLRELQAGDAPALLAHLGTTEVSRYIQPLPTTVEGFEQYIGTARQERAEGLCATFGVQPAGVDHVVGVVQIRALEAGFAIAEWSVVIGSSYWGKGLFPNAARLVLDFVFGSLGATRLEARTATMNGRGNGALRKVGAVQEGVLRRAFRRQNQHYDQLLWALLAEDWRLQRQRPRRVH